MRAKRREAFGQFRLTVYRSFTDAITPELRNDAKFLKWVRLPYALRYLDLLCAPLARASSNYLRRNRHRPSGNRRVSFLMMRKDCSQKLWQLKANKTLTCQARRPGQLPSKIAGTNF